MGVAGGPWQGGEDSEGQVGQGQITQGPACLATKCHLLPGTIRTISGSQVYVGPNQLCLATNISLVSRSAQKRPFKRLTCANSASLGLAPLEGAWRSSV